MAGPRRRRRAAPPPGRERRPGSLAVRWGPPGSVATWPGVGPSWGVQGAPGAAARPRQAFLELQPAALADVAPGRPTLAPGRLRRRRPGAGDLQRLPHRQGGRHGAGSASTPFPGFPEMCWLEGWPPPGRRRATPGSRPSPAPPYSSTTYSSWQFSRQAYACRSWSREERDVDWPAWIGAIAAAVSAAAAGFTAWLAWQEHRDRRGPRRRRRRPARRRVALPPGAPAPGRRPGPPGSSAYDSMRKRPRDQGS